MLADAAAPSQERRPPALHCRVRCPLHPRDRLGQGNDPKHMAQPVFASGTELPWLAPASAVWTASARTIVGRGVRSLSSRAIRLERSLASSCERVEPDRLGQLPGPGDSVDVALRRGSPVANQVGPASFQAGRSLPVMDGVRGEHRDARVPVFSVVPGEGGPAERPGSVQVGKALGKAGAVLQGLDWTSEKGLSSLTRGRLSERVTPMPASSWAVRLLGMGAHRSECRDSISGWMPSPRQDSVNAPEARPLFLHHEEVAPIFQKSRLMAVEDGEVLRWGGMHTGPRSGTAGEA